MNKGASSISIPQPCSENWDEMTPVDRGRFCASCQKTVVDLSCSTDQEVIDFFKRAVGSTPCVRFHSSQIAREMTEVKQPPFSFMLLKKIAATLILFQGIVTTAWAQKVKAPTTQQAKKAPDTAGKNRMVVKGTVMDQATGQMLADMVVSIAGIDFKATTGKDGRFRIVLPDSFTAQSVTISAAYSNGAGPQSTKMMDEVIAWEEVVNGREVILRRYPQDVLPPLYLRDSPPSHHYAGVPVQHKVIDVVKVQRKKSAWEKIRTSFRRKTAQ